MAVQARQPDARTPVHVGPAFESFHPQGVRLDGHLLRGGAATRTVDHCTSPPFVPIYRTGRPCATQGFGRAPGGPLTSPVDERRIEREGAAPRRPTPPRPLLPSSRPATGWARISAPRRLSKHRDGRLCAWPTAARPRFASRGPGFRTYESWGDYKAECPTAAEGAATRRTARKIRRPRILRRRAEARRAPPRRPSSAARPPCRVRDPCRARRRRAS
jgi:hypothetical protein